jgi:hypothetical protein
MFNLYYRPFSPGFRVRPQQEVPGFDIIDENSAVPSASVEEPARRRLRLTSTRTCDALHLS